LKLPVLVPALVDTVKVGDEDGFGDTDAGNEQVASEGHPETPNATLPLNPFSAVTVIVDDPDVP